MVFPSAQVAFQAARLPWLSGGIALISVLVFLSLPTPLLIEDRDPQAALEAAFAYWQTHGYLTPDDRILESAAGHFDDRRRPLALAAIRELGRRAMPDDDNTRDREQATLDELAVAARPDRGAFNPLPRDHVLRVYGFTPDSPRALTLGTHLFLYAGWVHLLAVVSLLFVLGASAEERLGRSAFALFFSLSALISVATHTLFEPESPMSLIGASGPVAALAALFTLRHRMGPVRMVVLTPGNRGLRLIPFELPAAAIAALWLVANLGLTVWLDEIGARNDLSVSVLAGGLGFGLFTGLALRGFGFESRVLAPDLETEAERNPDAPEVTRQVFEVAVSTGQSETAAEPLARQIRRLIRRNQLPEAAELWRVLVEQLPDHRLPPGDLVRIVPPLLASHHSTLARVALRQCVDAPLGEVGIGLALRILDLARGLDPSAALIAARRALELPELHESKRAHITRLIRELDPEGPPPLDAAIGDGSATDDALQFNDSGVLEVPADWESREPEYLGGRGAEDPIAIGEAVATQQAPQIDLASLPRFDGIQAVAAVPTRLMDDVLYFRLGNGRKAKVAYEQIQALAVAALRDISSKPVVVVDLLLNWTELGAAPLRSIRLRSDQFDPALLIPPVGSPTENLQAFLLELLDRSQALPLPDADAVTGRPFRVFKFMRGYQRRVLKVDC
jgi:membrane associated rhomboid family serine protease